MTPAETQPNGRGVTLVVLGVAQDGGLPQPGCACDRCLAAHADPTLRRHPVACGVHGRDGSFHLLEASRALPDQLRLWAKALKLQGVVKPQSVSLTHVHLGHVDGLGLFGKEVMNASELPLFASQSVLDALEPRSVLTPFSPSPITAETRQTPTERCGFQLEFVPVPHRDEAGDTHAIVVRGPHRSLLMLPDHDAWDQTLSLHGADSIRAWFDQLAVDVVLLDATFWDESELPDRDMSKVPHPTVRETLRRLGAREPGDAEVFLFHLNHTNPLHAWQSDECGVVRELGWAVARQGQRFEL